MIAKRAVSLRVATWNVEHARASRKRHGDAVRDVMRATPADVWVLTESDPDFAPGHDYRLLARSAEPHDIRTGRAWVTMWGHNDVQASHAIELTADSSRTAAAFVRLRDQIPILVYGTVLPWRSDSLWQGSLGERFSRALAAQAAEWSALRCQIDAELCVAGDFNQELSGSIRVGSVAGREALRRVLKDQGLTCPTTEPHDPVGEILGRGSIDHILISAGLRAVASDGQPQVMVIPPTVPLPRNLSDHYGVCVEHTHRSSHLSPAMTQTPFAKKDSQRRLQVAVNLSPEHIDAPIHAAGGLPDADVEWISPLRDDRFKK